MERQKYPFLLQNTTVPCPLPLVTLQSLTSRARYCTGAGGMLISAGQGLGLRHAVARAACGTGEGTWARAGGKPPGMRQPGRVRAIRAQAAAGGSSFFPCPGRGSVQPSWSRALHPASSQSKPWVSPLFRNLV